MILVIVGTQLPFDRLVKTVDEWAAAGAADVIAQVGPSAYQPTHIHAHPFLPPKKLHALLEQAELIVAHCGIGSILSALSHGKPIIVMPRSAARGEHRNDHQHATAKRFADHAGVTVAWDEKDLRRCLETITNGRKSDRKFAPLPLKAPRQLTDRLRAFLREGKR